MIQESPKSVHHVEPLDQKNIPIKQYLNPYIGSEEQNTSNAVLKVLPHEMMKTENDFRA